MDISNLKRIFEPCIICLVVDNIYLLDNGHKLINQCLLSIHGSELRRCCPKPTSWPQEELIRPWHVRGTFATDRRHVATCRRHVGDTLAIYRDMSAICRRHVATLASHMSANWQPTHCNMSPHVARHVADMSRHVADIWYVGSSADISNADVCN